MVVGNKAFSQSSVDVDLEENIPNHKRDTRKLSEMSGSPYFQCIDLEDDYKLKIYGYREHKVKTAAAWFLMTISFGVIALLCYWFKRLYLYMTHTQCTLIYASKLLIEENYKDQRKSYHVKNIKILNHYSGEDWKKKRNLDSEALLGERLEGCFSVYMKDGLFKSTNSVRFFNCRKHRFIWNPDLHQFYELTGLDTVPTSFFHKQRGLSCAEHSRRQAVYGSNEIVIQLKSFLLLLLEELLNPFIVFQFLSIILWCTDDYVLYASAILIVTIISLVASSISTYINQQDLHNRVCSANTAKVVRDSVEVEIPTQYLVPGDVLILPTQGGTMYCDAVLLNGSCITNESSLTGESNPIMKTPIPNSSVPYDSREHARHTLYCGTEIIQTRFYGDKHVLAVVARTGFNTTKGSVIRTMLYPTPADYRFEEDSYKFVGLLAFVAGLGFLYTVVTKLRRGIHVFVLMKEALDLITVVVPPALPAAMTIGAVHALFRLKRACIYCISPRAINVSGSVNCICFDKTGTLTEDGLDMWGVIVTDEDGRFSDPIRDTTLMDTNNNFLHALASCHTLTIIREKLCGDPMDLKIFESTNWQLEEPAANDDAKFDLLIPTIVKPPNVTDINSSSLELNALGKEIGIVKHFTFSSNLQRMAVITRVLGDSHYNIYCKGAPESIYNICLPDSVPMDFHRVLKHYTQKGYRVIAAAYRPLSPCLNYRKIQRLTREDVENDLIMLGLVILENKLKPETTPVISTLKEAEMRIVIVTGDNMLTAVSVARDCGIILPEQDVIAVNFQDNPYPHIYYTFADVSPEASVILPPFSADGETLKRSEDVKLHVDTLDDVPQASILELNDGVVGNNIFVLPTRGRVASAPKNYVFAVDGACWMFIKQHFPDLIPYIGVKAAVFSRMNPEQKQHLVVEMQQLGYVVAMCGDGANDCGALKAAHTGISLSNNESSAASPFTSKVQNISCIIHILRECRASLVITFTIFRFMALYSLTQFISLMILYSIDTNLTDLEFLFIDLFVIALCAFSLGHTPPYRGMLARRPPPSSLVSAASVVSLFCQVFVVGFVQLALFCCVQTYPWFQPYVPHEGGETSSYENYAVFSISVLQYVILAVTLHKGPPYVGYVWSNYVLLSCLVIITSVTLYVIAAPAVWVQEWMELQLPPVEFRLLVLTVAFVNLVLSLMVEFFVCDFLISNVLKRKMKENPKWRKKYANLERELSMRSNWPAISSEVDFTSQPSHWDKNTEKMAAADEKPTSNGSYSTPRRFRANSSSITTACSVPNMADYVRGESDALLSSQTTLYSEYFTPRSSFNNFPNS